MSTWDLLFPARRTALVFFQAGFKYGGWLTASAAAARCSQDKKAVAAGRRRDGWRYVVTTSASKSSIWRFVITEKAPTRAFSWLNAATTAFTFKTLLRHYAKWMLTPRSLNVKLGPRRNYHKGRAAIRHYANQPARPLWPLRRWPNFTLRDSGFNASLA